MKTYTGVFIKKNGEEREMNFVKVEDLPSEFLETKITGKRKKVNLSEGLELVWDLEHSEFRIFNWNTVRGNVVEKDLENDTRFLV
tara:strand:+ start:4308 stop:4562 length:255 start_codon:yes stop_codon:yes gene_type:complete